MILKRTSVARLGASSESEDELVDYGNRGTNDIHNVLNIRREADALSLCPSRICTGQRSLLSPWSL